MTLLATLLPFLLTSAAPVRERPPDPGDAAAFERWVQPDSVEALEILLAAPSSRHPASLWGHVLLRVRYRDDVPTPPGFAPVFQIGVEEAAPGEELGHTFAGIFGRLEAKLFVTPSHRIERRYRTVEGRGIKVFELDLDAAERRRVLERFWIVSRDRHRWGYAFFTDNCAGLLVELVGPALEPELHVGAPRFIRWPSSVLDRLARARRPDGRPLLRYAGEEPGSVDRAVEASAVRRALAEKLRLTGAPLDDIAAENPALRAAMYASLGEWGARQPESAEDVAAFLSESIDVELGDARRRSNRDARGEMVSVLGDALAALPPPPPRRPALRVAPAATGASGGYTARLAGGAVSDGDSTRAAAALDLAMVDEMLGDVRERGFRPDLGVRLLGARVRLEQARDGRAVLGPHEWTFAAFDSIRGGHGASFALRGFGDRTRGIDASGFAELGRSFGMASADGTSLLSLRLAAASGGAHLVGAGAAPAAAAHARLGARFRIGTTSLDRIEIAIEPLALATHRGHGWLGHAEIAIAQSFGRRDRPSVLRLSLRATTGPGMRATSSSPAPELAAFAEWQLP